MRNWIERIMLRLGFVPVSQAAISELIVFKDAYDARAAGFRSGRNPLLPTVQAWWPGAGIRGLCGRSVQRVTVTQQAACMMTKEGRVGDLLRKRQAVFGKDAVWVELDR